MDKDTLEKIIHWCAQNGKEKYAPHVISQQLNIPQNQIPLGFETLIDSLFERALAIAHNETGIVDPASQDDLFDTLLTFFEQLTPVHDSLSELFNKHTLSLSDLTLMPGIISLTQGIFHCCNTSDNLTYTLIFCHIFYTWLGETDANLPKTSHRINTATQLIYPD